MAERKKINNTIVRIMTGDITDLEVEAFVFYAQESLELGSGFGNAIASRGGPSIKKELEEIGSLPLTKAIITRAGEMKAQYIIHSNGPKFQEADILEKLRDTMLNTLKKADEKGIRQVAFPAMGAGFYGIPAVDSAKVMLKCLEEHLANGSSIEEVIICLLDKKQYQPFDSQLTA